VAFFRIFLDFLLAVKYLIRNLTIVCKKYKELHSITIDYIVYIAKLYKLGLRDGIQLVILFKIE